MVQFVKQSQMMFDVCIKLFFAWNLIKLDL